MRRYQNKAATINWCNKRQKNNRFRLRQFTICTSQACLYDYSSANANIMTVGEGWRHIVIIHSYYWSLAAFLLSHYSAQRHIITALHLQVSGDCNDCKYCSLIIQHPLEHVSHLHGARWAAWFANTPMTVLIHRLECLCMLFGNVCKTLWISTRGCSSKAVA